MSSMNDVMTPEAQDQDPDGHWDQDYAKHRDALVDRFIVAQTTFRHHTRVVLARLDELGLIERIAESVSHHLDPIAEVLSEAHLRTGGGCHPSWVVGNYRYLDDHERQQIDQQQAEHDRQYARLVVEGLKGRELTRVQREFVWASIQGHVAGIDPALYANLKPQDA